MSRDFSVYLHAAKMPAPPAWRAEIKQQGFACDLDDDFAPLTFSGFLPCPVEEKISGFEYYARELDDDDFAELDGVQPFNYSITFCAGSRPAETMAALAAASCLTKLSGGVLYDFYSGEMILAEHAVEWAKSQTA